MLEKAFCEFVNQKVLDNGTYTVVNLAGQLMNMLKNDAQNSSTDMLFRIAYDLVEPPANDESSLAFLNHKSFWQFRKQITIKSFVASFTTFWQNITPEQQAEYHLLNDFFKQMDQLKVDYH